MGQTFMKRKLSFLLVLVALVAAAAPAPAQDRRKVSLLVSYCDKGQKICGVQHLEKFDFVNGDLVSRKRVVTLDHDRDGYAGSVTQNRFLQTAPKGKIFDLRKGKFVGVSRARPARMEFDGLPGVVSPDGKKVVDSGNFGSTNELQIRVAGKPAVLVKGDFQITVCDVCCALPTLPLLWIDDERILTQTSNGNLVTVSLDGKISPLVQVPCEDNPALKRNLSGKIVYECGTDEYFVDVENRKVEKVKKDLGNGFARDFVGPEDVYYYNDEEIGRGGLDAVTIKSYLAMLHAEPKDGMIYTASIKTVKVWDATKRSWTQLIVDGWSAEIVGWIEE